VRFRYQTLLVAVSFALLASTRPSAPAALADSDGSPPQLPGWNLVWYDEFDGPNGSGVDPTRWRPIVEGNGSGNHELEYYTDRVKNAYLEDGMLVIAAYRETFSGPDGTRDYTSARLVSHGLEQRYGRFEARMKLPDGKGMWPAFWMMGTNIGQVGWPACGEIDIMENVWQQPSTVYGSIHGPGYTGATGVGSPYSLPSGERFADGFHVFAVEWDPTSVRFFVDGTNYETRTRADLPPGGVWEFDHPFFLLVNTAVGGDWPGSPDPTTPFPQLMYVDYVRVYERPGPTLDACDPARGRHSTMLDVRIGGDQFVDGAEVSFGDKIEVRSSRVVSPTEIDVRIKIKKKATRGPRDVVVTNPDGGTGTGHGFFQVD
jgi:beta-glucanase (GH16 family)